MFRSAVRIVAFSVLALSASEGAWAQCTSFNEAEFRAMVESSKTAIDQDDGYKHKTLMAEFMRSLPCIKAQLPKDAWAQFLVAEAIVRYTTDQDWDNALNTALGVWPDVPGVPEFILNEWGPKAPNPPMVKPIPAGVTLFLDGVLVDRPLMLSGLHVVQKLQDGQWDTQIVEDKNWPDPWFAEVVPLDDNGDPIATPEPQPEGPIEVAGRAALGILVGAGFESQSVDPAGNYLGNGQHTGPIAGLSFWGEMPLASVVGVFVDAKLPVQIPSVKTEAEEGGFEVSTDPIILPDVYGGFAVVLPTFAFHLGGGITQLQVSEGGKQRTFTFPQPRIAIESVSSRADFLLGGGFTPSATHVDMKATFHVGGKDGVSWRVGPLLEAANAKFTEEKPGYGRTASVFRGRVILLISVTWGREDN